MFIARFWQNPARNLRPAELVRLDVAPFPRTQLHNRFELISIKPALVSNMVGEICIQMWGPAREGGLDGLANVPSRRTPSEPS